MNVTFSKILDVVRYLPYSQLTAQTIQLRCYLLSPPFHILPRHRLLACQNMIFHKFPRVGLMITQTLIRGRSSLVNEVQIL